MRYLEPIIIVFVALLATLLIFLGFQYYSLRHAAIVSGHQAWLSLVLKDHAPLPPGDANIVRPWMTFDYVNRLFGLPPDFLKGRLNITDTHYPKITLSGYAKEVHSDQATFVSQVEQVIETYQKPASI